MTNPNPAAPCKEYDDFTLCDGEYTFEQTVNAPRRTLRIWASGDRQRACISAKHGPLCDRCVDLDLTAAALLKVCIDGDLDVFDTPDGMHFRINEAGKTRVETAIRRGGFVKGLDA